MNRYKIKLNLELTAHAKNFTLINIIITITHISIYFFSLLKHFHIHY